MKKLLLVLPLVLCGCLQPNEKIQNPECIDMSKFWVLQLDKDVSLLSGVFNVIGGWKIEDIAVKTKDLDIWPGTRYDGESIVFGSDVCAAFDGTYSYTTVMGSTKTIRMVKFVNSQTINPRYTEWQAEQEKKKKDIEK